MAKAKKNQPKSAFEMSKEDLGKLDQETLVGMVMRMSEQISQLSEILQIMVREKHAPKTERFQNPDQLNLFGEQETPVTEDVEDQSGSNQEQSDDATAAKAQGARDETSGNR